MTHRGASPARGGVCYLRLPRVTRAAVCQGVLGLGDGLGQGRPLGAGPGVPKLTHRGHHRPGAESAIYICLV